MLNQAIFKYSRRNIRRKPASRQSGVVMLVALIVLVVMTLAGLGLMRSMDTTNLIAGNLAFKQAATQAGDMGIESAVGWLESRNVPGSTNPLNLAVAGAAFYSPGAIIGARDFLSNSLPNGQVNPMMQSIDSFWQGLTAAGVAVCYPQVKPMPAVLTCVGKGSAANTNDAGDFIGIVIQRLCTNPGDRTNVAVTQCPVLPTVTALSTGNNEGPGVGTKTLTSTSVGVFYRITAQVTGPRNTVSYVQAIVSM